MIRINLLDQPRMLQKRGLAGTPMRRQQGALSVFLIVVALLGGWRWQLARQTAIVDSTIAGTAQDLARSKDAAKAADLARVRKTWLSERLSLIARIRVAQRDAASLLAVVSQSLTDGLWLLELAQRNGVVEIDGRAMSLNAVIEFVADLQNSGHFEGVVRIVTTSTESLDEASVVRFSLRGQTRAATLLPDGARKGG